jgi:hypothetical protein
MFSPFRSGDNEGRENLCLTGRVTEVLSGKFLNGKWKMIIEQWENGSPDWIFDLLTS